MPATGVLAVHQFGLQHPVRGYPHGGIVAGSVVAHQVRPPEAAVAHKGRLWRAWVRLETREKRLELRPPGCVESDHVAASGAESIRPSRGRPGDLTPNGRGIELPASDHPLLTVEQIQREDRDSLGSEGECRPIGKAGEEGAITGEPQAVPARVELGAMLVEATVGLHPLALTDPDLTLDGSKCSAHRVRGTLQTPSGHGDLGDPHKVLPRHPQLRALQDPQAADALLVGEALLEDQQRPRQRQRDADLVVPPVRALEILLNPVIEGAQNRREEPLVPSQPRPRLAPRYGHALDAARVGGGLPARAARSRIVHVGPTAIWLQAIDPCADGIGARRRGQGVLNEPKAHRLYVAWARSGRNDREREDKSYGSQHG